MTPTLHGRIQTRIFVTLIIGGIWTLIITPVLPAPQPVSTGDLYKVTFTVLLTQLVLGIGWEFVYHWLMGFRWEKDWPSFFLFIEGITEAVLLWIVLSADIVPGISEEPGDRQVYGSTFLVLFITTWIVTWAWIQGPMKVMYPRWRFRGGRLI
jgi:hypothetical protein